jgi:SHS2 domain-containing protein
MFSDTAPSSGGPLRRGAEALERRPYEELPHTADRALRIFGRDLSELLVNAARGMYSLMAPARAAPAAPETARSIAIEALDAEALLVAWLSELLFFAESERLVFERFEFGALAPERLSARAAGRPAAGFEVLVKAVTYHALAIRAVPGGLTATVVFDV